MSKPAASFELDDVIITNQLSQRPSRTPDFKAESEALTQLARKLAAGDDNALQALTDVIVEVGLGQSAGVSIETEVDGVRCFRWEALSGLWACYRGGVMPFDASPCGVVIDRGVTMLFESPERFFPEARIDPLIHEILLTPLKVRSRAIGTLWIISHDQSRRFDNEDARLIDELAQFASVSFQLVSDRKALADALPSRAKELADEKLRESDERQAFLLRLSDAVRPLADAYAIQSTTARLVGEYLGVDRSMYAEVEGAAGEETGIVRGQFVRRGEGGTEGVRFPPRFSYADFGAHRMATRRSGQLLVVNDIETDPTADGAERTNWRRAAVRAAIVAPLVKGGELVAEFGVQSSSPRTWTESELLLVRDAAERTWAAAERSRAEAELRASEDRYRSLFERMDEAYAVVEVLKGNDGAWSDFRFIEVNPAFVHHTRIPYPVGKTATELLASPNPRWAELYGQVIETGVPLRTEESENTLGLTFDLNMFALDRDRNRVAVLFTDITERKRAEEDLRESAERFRLIVENARDYAIFTTDPNGVITDWRGGAQAVFGYSGEECLGRSSDDLYTPEDIAAGEPAREREVASREGKAPNVRWHVRKNGSRVFIEGVNTALRDGEGKLTGFLKIGRDATERHAADRRQALLLAELQHRVRNILAMIRSMVRQTSDAYDSLDEFIAHLVGRLDAMARTQVLLTRAAGAQIDLETLVRDELDFQLADEARLNLAGPAVALSSKAAKVLTLALHELATNSIKYGALSDPEGRVSVTWEVTPQEPAPWLRLSWQEHSDAVEGVAERDGFGTELIQSRVPYELHGEGSLNVMDGGVRADIAFPLIEG